MIYGFINFLLVTGFGFGVLYLVLRTLLQTSEKQPVTTDSDFIRACAEEIRKRISNRSGLSARELLAELENDLDNKQAVESESDSIQRVPVVSWSNWYSEHSINILLFIGAFLVVATASILVGFQWHTISGFAKARVVSLASIFFLVCGLLLYGYPRVKSAGAVFAGIGTILMPFVGFAWYTFVLRDQGYSLGTVWTLTSLAASVVSVLVSVYITHPLFTYIGSFGLLSSMLGIVHSNKLSGGYYLLSSQVSAILILIFGSLVPRNSRTAYVYAEPIRLYGVIVVPVTIMAGLLYVGSSSSLLTVETGIAVLLSAVYYVILYCMERLPYQTVPAMILFPLGMYFFLRGYGIELQQAYVIVGSLAFLYIPVADYFSANKKKEESDAAGFMSFAVTVFVYIFSFLHTFTPETRTILSLLPALSSLMVWLLFDSDLYTLGITVFLAITLRTGIRDWFAVSNLDVLGYSYLYLAELWYFAKIVLPAGRPQKHVFIRLSTALFFLFALAGRHVSVWYMPTVSTVITATFFHSAWYFKGKYIYIAALAGLYWVSSNVGQAFHIEQWQLAYIFSTVSVFLYGLSYGLTPPWQYITRFISSAGFFVTAFGYYQYGAYGPDSMEELFLMYNAYACFLFFIIDAYIRKSSRASYAASFAGMLALTWSMSILHVEESLAYTVVWGAYAMVLGYLRRQKLDGSNAGILDTTGIFLLTVLPFFKSFSGNGTTAAFVMGTTGLVLIVTGVTRNHQVSRNFGVFSIVGAVISQSYAYIFGLEKWIITGILAFLFLTVAFYLLVRRKDTDR